MLTTREELSARLGPEGAAWLDAALGEAETAARAAARVPAQGGPPDPQSSPGPQGSPREAVPAWELRFAAAGRGCRLPEAADAVRVLLLRTARPDAAAAARLYARGTAAERRAVLLALPHLPLAPDQGVALVEDALRTNDTRLVAAAVGTYAAAHLDAHAWRHAVLKCLFTGVPTAAVADLADRARGDAELARMLRDFAAERTAAARPVPADLEHVLTLTAKEA